MDIKMPIMDGLTATKLIKQKRPDLPIVAQTAFALDYEVKEFAYIFDNYISKPIIGKQIVDICKKYIDKNN